eukprot:a387_3.p1 GENE.a387_3~~a387_3.p1  ORF type:complete len:406 (-),score=104.38 a387_3:11-1198(-)
MAGARACALSTAAAAAAGSPQAKTAMICLSGTPMEYFDAGRAAGVMPNTTRLGKAGEFALCSAVMPTFALANQASILTATMPNEHGVLGSFERAKHFYPFASTPLVPSVLERRASQGARVALVSARRDVHEVFGAALGAAAFCTADKGSMQRPWDATASALELALRTLDAVDVLYVGTEDSLQHRFAPRDPEAIEFMAAIDAFLGALDARGVTIGLTSDHGMSTKSRFDGSPRLAPVADALERLCGASFENGQIAVASTSHGSALSPLILVDVGDSVDTKALARSLRSIRGVYSVLTRSEAVTAFSWPDDIGADLVVVADNDSLLDVPKERVGSPKDLRGHGSFYEAKVPMLLSRPLPESLQRRLGLGKARNWHLAEFLGLVDGGPQGSATPTRW